MTGSGTTRTNLVEVSLPLPVEGGFTYALDGPSPDPGTRVLVPFRQRTEIGLVLGPGTPVPRMRNVLSVLEQRPSLGPDLMSLAEWMSQYYVAPIGIALRAMVPAALVDRSRDYLTLLRDPVETDGLTPAEIRLTKAIGEPGTAASVTTVRKNWGKGSVWPHVRRLTEAGLVEHRTVPPKVAEPKRRTVLNVVRWLESLSDLEEVFARAPKQRSAYERLVELGGSAPLAGLLEAGFGRGSLNALRDKELVEFGEEEVVRDPFLGPVERGPELTPTSEQSAALRELREGLGEGGTFLLHGVTGSGKTLVYVKLLEEVLARGEGAIVLVPEIALTPQTVARFRQAFGDQVAVLHSALSHGERYDAWRQLRDGAKRIAIGARSAVFAPIERLGAVIVDEEHDGSYKQSEAPRYHGRDVAVYRASRVGAVCVLGSATPSLESWHNARTGKYRLLSLPDRVGGGVLPRVHIVDLKGRKDDTSSTGGAAPTAGAVRMLSPLLLEGLQARLERREQSILLLNRRGYASFAQCRACGDVKACHQCSVSLTYHRRRADLICHHCGHVEPVPESCDRCGSDELSFRGLGTEQVERLVGEVLPAARVARMDVDTTGGKWAHHEILTRVKEGAVDILLGTQMIAKGLDFPRVTLVGVINADVGLHFPDFRSTERTFQLLAQVAGRAGRGALKGEVIIQTYVPDHYVIRAATLHDYLGFVERELGARKDPAYPPHTKLARVLLSSPGQEEAMTAARSLGSWLARVGGPDVEVLGPAPAPIEKLHGRFRWHVLLRTPSNRALGRALRATAKGFTPGPDVRVSIDRDPAHLM